MATKNAAKGAVVKYAATATPTTTVDNLRSCKPKPGAREMLNSTTHGSTTTKDYLRAPLRDTNEITFRFLWDPADTIHELLRSHHSAGTTGYLTAVMPDTGAAEWAMTGNITNFDPLDLDPETGLMEVECTFKATGPDTYTQ